MVFHRFLGAREYVSQFFCLVLSVKSEERPSLTVSQGCCVRFNVHVRIVSRNLILLQKRSMKSMHGMCLFFGCEDRRANFCLPRLSFGDVSAPFLEGGRREREAALFHDPFRLSVLGCVLRKQF